MLYLGHRMSCMNPGIKFVSSIKFPIFCDKHEKPIQNKQIPTQEETNKITEKIINVSEYCGMKLKLFWQGFDMGGGR